MSTPYLLLAISFALFLLSLVNMAWNFISNMIKQKLPWIFSLKYIMSLSVLILFFMSVFLANLSVQFIGKDHNKFPGVVFYAIMATFQAIALNTDYIPVTEAIAESVSYCIYIKLYLGTLFMVAPIVGGVTLFSVLKDFFPGVQLSAKFWIRHSKRVQIFSYLNEQSFNLAVSLAKNHPKYKIVFANTKDEDVLDSTSNLISRSGENGFFCLADDLSSIKISNAQKVKYYFVHENDIQNLDDTIYLLKNGKHNWNSNATVEINVFAQSDIAKDVLEKLSNELSPQTSTSTKIQTRIIPYKTTTIYNMLLEQPLYQFISSPESPEVLNIGIIGENEWATEIFKTILWCGQIQNKTLNIYCIAQNITSYKKKLHYLIPELNLFGQMEDGLPYCNIHFSARRDSHYNYLEKYNKIDIPIWFVCDDSEETSIEIALYLRKIIGSTYTGLTNPPKGIVYYQTVNSHVSDTMNNNQQNLKDDNQLEYNCRLHAFGSVGDQYASKNFEGSLINLAQMIDDIHSQNADITSVNEYRRRSSLAAAVHIPYKLYMQGLINQSTSGQAIYDEIKCILMNQWTEDYQNIKGYEIGYIEHIRWVAYMRSLGYVNISIDDWIDHYRSQEGEAKIRQVKENKGQAVTNSINTKDHIRKLHTCLVAYHEKPAIEEIFLSNVIGYSDKNYDLLEKYYHEGKLDPLNEVSYQLLLLEQDIGTGGQRDFKYDTAKTVWEIAERYRSSLETKKTLILVQFMKKVFSKRVVNNIPENNESILVTESIVHANDEREDIERD